MFKTKNNPVQPSDQFIKAGDAHGKIWEVVDLWVASDGILHARLRSCEGKAALITIAAGVLNDSNFWQPVQNDQATPL